jgi:hypothetical protein
MSDPVPIQPVDSPVICKPYYEPTHYWEYERNTGRAQKREGRRPSACQLEAAETAIFLNEIRGFRRDGKRGQPRWNPEFADADFALLWDSEGNPEPLPRYACKMARCSALEEDDKDRAKY